MEHMGWVFDSNYKYGCGALANIINMDLKIVIFRLRNIDLGAKFGKKYKYGPKYNRFRIKWVMFPRLQPHTNTEKSGKLPPPPPRGNMAVFLRQSDTTKKFSIRHYPINILV